MFLFEAHGEYRAVAIIFESGMPRQLHAGQGRTGFMEALGKIWVEIQEEALGQDSRQSWYSNVGALRNVS